MAILLQIFTLVLCAVFMAVFAMNQTDNEVKIGVIIDLNSSVGKVQKAAMEIALQPYLKNNLSLVFRTPRRSLPSGYAETAEELVKDKRVKVILGMNRREDTTEVADISSRVNIPVVSFSSIYEDSKYVQTRWPLLARMGSDEAESMKCIAAILRRFDWTRVVPVYDNPTNLVLFKKTIQQEAIEVEDSLVLPLLSEYPDPKSVVKRALRRMEEMMLESRVFVVLTMSMDTLVHLVDQAKMMGFMGNGSVWIFSETVMNDLELANSSLISSMKGALGIRSYYRRESHKYLMFREKILMKVKEVQDPGFYGVRAYDSIITVVSAIQNLSGEEDDGKKLLNGILASGFAGLSGRIKFVNGGLTASPEKIIVNVDGTKIREVVTWSPSQGFSRWPSIIWPGNSTAFPIGWSPPTQKLIVTVPGSTVFDKFVKVVNQSNNEYSGFCADLFNEVRKNLGYDLQIEFQAINGSYEGLVDGAFNHKYYAIIGDFTILSWRLHKVHFTPAYMESSLAMIVPAVPRESAWIFVKPFTGGMWAATGILLICIILAVWLMERHGSADFEGSVWRQIGQAVYFTLTSIFFAQRERLQSPLSRALVVVWLCFVLIVTTSYTANLSSMLTVRQLYPTVTDIRWLVENNKTVGCDSSSFLYAYLMDAHKFKPRQIVNITNEYDYMKMLETENISAAFFELPYQKAFTKEYCGNKFMAITYNYRFGGLAFGFAKKTKVFDDVSKAILDLMEKGAVKNLSDRYFAPTEECLSLSGDKVSHAKLGFEDFKGLFFISGITATVCLVLYNVCRKVVRRDEEDDTVGSSSRKKMRRLKKALRRSRKVKPVIAID